MSQQQPASTVNLARESTRWSQADSAGGYTMRYITAMRNYLIEMWSDSDAADKSLVLLLNHLSTKGFGEAGKGKLRDFLLRSARSAATAHHRREESNAAPPVDSMKVTDPNWLRHWNACLLGRVWRSLERHQHANEGNSEYSILRASKDHPKDDLKMLTTRITTETKKAWSEDDVKNALASGQRRFAQLIADEVTDTLEEPSAQDVKDELKALGLSHLVEPFVGK